jgi:hypothetical protein
MGDGDRTDDGQAEPHAAAAPTHPVGAEPPERLISPVSWSHHWVWGETAVLTLALLGRRYQWRGGLIAAAGGLAVFAAAPQWWFPSAGTGNCTGRRGSRWPAART